jgi:DNA-binding response OmpR family regulator
MPKKIMVVDDEENLLILIGRLLETEGLDVITAKTGRECMSILNKEKPDLLLLDMMMPGMNGIEVAEAIRSDPKTRNTRIAFLTVVGANELSKNRLRKIKALDYITKPFDNKALVKRVKELL